MPENQADAERDAADKLSARVGATEARDKAAVESLQITAKWITGGIMVAAGGIIAGSSLTSLGSLGLNETRLWIAVAAGLTGFLTLGIILMSALSVLVPRTYDVAALLGGETMTARQRRIVFRRVQDQLPPNTPDIATLARDYRKAFQDNFAATMPGVDQVQADVAKLNRVAAFLQMIESTVRFEHSRLLFTSLKHQVLLVMPVVVLAFGTFAWAANPPKDRTTDLRPLARDLDVEAAERPYLNKLLGEACVGAKLRVVIYREWPSGTQDALTAPTEKCLPVRLRLDHGALTATQ